jgi:hypothetical protein
MGGKLPAVSKLNFKETVREYIEFVGGTLHDYYLPHTVTIEFFLLFIDTFTERRSFHLNRECRAVIFKFEPRSTALLPELPPSPPLCNCV